MSTELIKKIIRCLVVALIFFPALRIVGMDGREAQSLMVMLSLIVIFSLLLKNVWITLFIVWSILLYSLFKFRTGQIYITNIFLGATLYYLIKVAFKKEHINFFINGFLWFVALNCFYMICQHYCYDFIFFHANSFGITLNNPPPNVYFYGFMGCSWALGCLLVLAIPLLAAKNTITSKIGAILLFFPLHLCHVSLCMVAGIIGLLFVLWFQIPKIVWATMLIGLILFGGFYINKVDPVMWGNRGKIWRVALTDAAAHPILGLGLDSFRNETKNKPYKYMQKSKEIGSVMWVEVWDNPHNLYISLFMEFSLIGLIIFVGYMRGLTLKFIRAIKSDQLIGLAGFIIVFLGISVGHFPIFLGAFMPILIPIFALTEVSCG